LASPLFKNQIKLNKMAKKQQSIYVDKTYKLTRGAAPLSYMLCSKHTRRKPLLYFDESEGVNKPLRYARNQKSPFEDEQDGNAILEPIIFEDGFLHVRKENQVLQEFLSLHPDNGTLFMEVNTEKDAQAELEKVDVEVDALIAARSLDINRAEQIARGALSLKTEKMTSAEIKRDILLFARQYPKDFLDVLNDPMLELISKVYDFFSNGLLSYRNNKDVHFNFKGNKKKMLTVPFGETRDYIVASYLQSDDGIETLKMLEGKLENLVEV
jgi:hypothetical protein